MSQNTETLGGNGSLTVNIIHDHGIVGKEGLTITGSNIGVTATTGPTAKGIQAWATATCEGGAITVDSADDSLHANGSLGINGGNVAISSGDDAIRADASIEIGGGEIDIAKAYHGRAGSGLLARTRQLGPQGRPCPGPPRCCQGWWAEQLPYDLPDASMVVEAAAGWWLGLPVGVCCQKVWRATVARVYDRPQRHRRRQTNGVYQGRGPAVA